MAEIDPTKSMRPYRRVDMGAELEDHEARLKKIERLEGQLRAFQVIALALASSLFALGQRGCVNFDDLRMEQASLRQEIDAIKRSRPETIGPETIESMQQTDEDHAERLRELEKRFLRKYR